MPFYARNEITALIVNVVHHVRATEVLEKMALLLPLYCNELNGTVVMRHYFLKLNSTLAQLFSEVRLGSTIFDSQCLNHLA